MGKVRVYVGSDGKLHFVDSAGADTVLPFKNSFIPESAQRAYSYSYVNSLSIIPNFTGKALLFVTSIANQHYTSHSIGSGVGNQNKLIGEYGNSGTINSLFIGDVVSGTSVVINATAATSSFTINLVQIGE